MFEFTAAPQPSSPPPPSPPPPRLGQIPLYLLPQICSHLPLQTLYACLSVSHSWRSTLLSYRRFRVFLFLEPPCPSDHNIRRPVDIHPVLHHLKSKWSQREVPITLSKRKRSKLEDQAVKERSRLEDAAVKEHFATSPALVCVDVVMPGHCVKVCRREGVRVWDVAMGVKELFCGMAKKVERCGESWGANEAVLDGFRQTNRMRREVATRRFIALFRYDAEEEEEEEEEGWPCKRRVGGSVVAEGEGKWNRYKENRVCKVG